ncbi:MAG TPA: putative toxin-antitoxin system toxin component, PIN family [Phycisphaerae bacterium]|nr:putative toxin-antitoxin system toxin component, PIN family [Phycisphaerae bacterium]
MNGTRAVFDCNVYFQALINEEGPAGRCLSAALHGEIELYISRFVIDELRRTGMDLDLRAKFRHITDQRLNRLIANVEKVGRVLAQVPEQFVYERDPDDAHYVNLALAAAAKFVVSRDNDLLALMDGSRTEGREFRSRFPSLEIVDPKTFLRILELHRTGS